MQIASRTLLQIKKEVLMHLFFIWTLGRELNLFICNLPVAEHSYCRFICRKNSKTAAVRETAA